MSSNRSTTPTNNSVPPAKSQNHATFFEENGYTEPFSLSNSSDVARLRQAANRVQASRQEIKFSVIADPYGDRKAHLYSSLVHDIATDQAILKML